MKVLEFILLLVSTTSFLVYEKIPLNTYATKAKKELKEIGALHGLEQLKFSDFEYTKNAITYQLSSVKSKAVFFNVNMLSTSINTESSVVLSLNWTPRTGDTNYISPYHSIYSAAFSKKSNSLKSESIEIEFEVEVSKFLFSKGWTYNTDDSIYTPSGSIDNTYISFKVKCLSESPYTEDLLLEIINAFLTENRSKMNAAFTTDGVEVYYKELPLEQSIQKVYTQTSTNIAFENNIDLTLESAPEYTINDDLIFKKKGKLNDLDISGSAILSDSSSYQKFYINKALIKNLISQNLFNIIYEQGNNPSPKYELTVEYLKQIMDVSYYSDSTKLKVIAEMTDVVFNDEDAISGTLTFTVSVIETTYLDTLLDFTLNIGFEFTPTLFQNGLNFVLLGKNLSIKDFKATQTLRNQELLLNWIENTYLVALGNNEFNLLSLSLNLSPYFSGNKLSYEFINDYLCITKL